MLFKKRQTSYTAEEGEQKVEVSNQQTAVKFYSLLDIVNAERILKEVKDGNLVFLNIGRIMPYPDRKKKFLESLKLSSEASRANVRMVSDDTVMVAPSGVPIEIRSLSPLKEYEQAE